MYNCRQLSSILLKIYYIYVISMFQVTDKMSDNLLSSSGPNSFPSYVKHAIKIAP